MADALVTPQPVGWAQIDVETRIDAPPERVWKALTDEVGAWWNGDFAVYGPTSRFRVEAFPGGRMYEETPEGAGCLWFHVTVVEPGKRLDFAGDVSIDWGGPLRSHVSVRLVPDGAGTRLTLTDVLMGRLEGRTADGLSSGWRQLFGTRLRKHAESA